MTNRDFMQLAISMAEQCTPDDPESTPRVGAVIAIDGDVVQTGKRGPDDHAEKIALETVRSGVDLTKAIVYTTLEPCTQHVRRRTQDACADRLVAARVKKVVIGILDPNQGVCGKGVLQLQQAGIEVELFPHDLAVQIRRINADFIRAQQSLGIEITEPRSGQEVRRWKCVLKGSLVNPPSAGDEVYAIVRKGDNWWPQGKISPSPGTNDWVTEVSVRTLGQNTVYIVKANALGKALIHYYYKVGEMRKRFREQFQRDIRSEVWTAFGNDYPAIVMQSLPKGLDAEDWVEIKVIE